VNLVLIRNSIVQSYPLLHPFISNYGLLAKDLIVLNSMQNRLSTAISVRLADDRNKCNNLQSVYAHRCFAAGLQYLMFTITRDSKLLSRLLSGCVQSSIDIIIQHLHVNERKCVPNNSVQQCHTYSSHRILKGSQICFHLQNYKKNKLNERNRQEL
jgi:hypothetical protein